MPEQLGQVMQRPVLVLVASWCLLSPVEQKKAVPGPDEGCVQAVRLKHRALWLCWYSNQYFDVSRFDIVYCIPTMFPTINSVFT